MRREYQNVLGINLTGIYVHGSIAFGCFNWESSDIDYIVVINEPLSLKDKVQIMEETVRINSHAPPKGIEMSIVLAKHCTDFTYPTPFELHFSNTHLEQYHHSPLSYCLKMFGEDADLAAHFTVIKSRGTVLAGAPIKGVFGPIDSRFYVDSIRQDIENAVQDVIGNPVYVILNLCRVAAYLFDGLILSKPDGGNWALQHLPSEYHELIKNTVARYQSAYDQYINQDLAICFCRYMLGQLH